MHIHSDEDVQTQHWRAMKKGEMTVWGFGLAATLAIVAAFLPLLKDQRLNVAFLSVGVVFFVLALAAANKNRSSGNGPPAA